MLARRSVRQFSPEPVPSSLVEDAITVAASAPSGAHAQPWTFVMVTDAAVRSRLRAAAEAEEHISYQRRMPADWQRALRRLGTDEVKAHLTDAPHLVVVFAHAHYAGPNGYRRKYYYVNESVGVACGFLLSALQVAGLAALTHTPSPMRFLNEVLGRPLHERPYLVIPVGYPAAGATVPDLRRKPLSEVLVRV